MIGPCDGAGERREVVESEGEGVFEIWENGGVEK